MLSALSHLKKRKRKKKKNNFIKIKRKKKKKKNLKDECASRAHIKKKILKQKICLSRDMRKTKKKKIVTLIGEREKKRGFFFVDCTITLLEGG